MRVPRVCETELFRVAAMCVDFGSLRSTPPAVDGPETRGEPRAEIGPSHVAVKKKSTTTRSTRLTNTAARKKTAKKKTAKKTASARRGGRPRGSGGKRPGSAKTRRTSSTIAAVILEECERWTRAQGAVRLGLETTDIKNLRAGNPPGAVLMLRLVHRGRIDPHALIVDKKLKKLPSRVSTRGATHDRIAARIRKLAKAEDAAELAKRTGLSLQGIYQCRIDNTRRRGLQTILGFIDAGFSANYIFFGKT